jgi:hypothetical protein
MDPQRELEVTAIKPKDTLLHDVRNKFGPPQIGSPVKATTSDGYAARPDFGLNDLERLYEPFQDSAQRIDLAAQNRR